MIFLTCIQNFATIGPVVSEIICPIKISRDGKQTNRWAETGGPFFHTLGVMTMTHRRKYENTQTRLDSITILPWVRSGIKK